jgi:PPOX class probable F420-dependent enzyme
VELPVALEFAASRRHGVLVTLRRDGRPQTSDIVYVVVDGTIKISITADRAKTKNLRRDPRAVLHVSAPDLWSYVSLDGTVELTDVTRTPGDDVGRELADLYERASGGPHPDWDEYYRAMVDEQRLVARFHPSTAIGQVRR